MFNKEETEFLNQNFRAAIMNARKANATSNAMMWTNILLKLQSMPTEEENNEVYNNTTKYAEFNSSNIKSLRDVVSQNLDLSKHDLAFKLGKINYSLGVADIALQIIINPDGKGKPVDKIGTLKLKFLAELHSYASLGFKESHFLKEFKWGKANQTYQFVGFIPKGKKYIYNAIDISSGTIYKFTDNIRTLIV